MPTQGFDASHQLEGWSFQPQQWTALLSLKSAAGELLSLITTHNQWCNTTKKLLLQTYGKSFYTVWKKQGEYQSVFHIFTTVHFQHHSYCEISCMNIIQIYTTALFRNKPDSYFFFLSQFSITSHFCCYTPRWNNLLIDGKKICWSNFIKYVLFPH